MALSGCLPAENDDYCMIINEWAWLRSQACLIEVKVHLGSVLKSELRQKCVSSEKIGVRFNRGTKLF